LKAALADVAARSPTKTSPGAGRGLLEPRGHVDLSTADQRLTRARVPRHHLARVDSDPHPEPNPPGPLQICAQRVDLFDQLGGGPDRPHRVVLVERRDPENSHDGVADELLDGPAVTLQDRPRPIEVATQDGPQRFRVELFAERR